MARTNWADANDDIGVALKRIAHFGIVEVPWRFTPFPNNVADFGTSFVQSKPPKGRIGIAIFPFDARIVQVFGMSRRKLKVLIFWEVLACMADHERDSGSGPGGISILAIEI